MPTLVNTLGASNANSYVATLAEAAAMLDGQLIARTAWNAASDDDKTRALITAARTLDSVLVWQGTRLNPDVQAMAWPRSGYYALGGVKYGPGAVVPNFPTTWPVNLPLMQTLQAAYLLERAAAGHGVGSVNTNEAIKRVEAGSVKLEYRDAVTTYAGGYTIPNEILVLADPWLEYSKSATTLVQNRLVRG